MANEMIALKAKANQLGVTGYRKMTKAELEHAIKTAKGTGSAPAKAKGKPAATNGVSPAKGKGKTTAASPAKGKGKSTSAPAKSTAKTTPAKGKAATGTAKRQATAKAPAAKKTTAKVAPKTSTARGRKNLPARVNIDRTKIDWKAPTNVGTTGKRGDVMSGLRKFKGNYDKVFELLQPNAKKYYPGKDKHEAERLLRWLINRVAYDFVLKSGQHTSGNRTAYGTSKAPQDVRRRELREEQRKASEKAARAAKRNAPARKAPASARGKAAPKGKTSTARGKGKPAAAAKGKGRR